MNHQFRIGVIGLGKMGGGIARNLVRKGFPVTVVGHRNRIPVDEFIALGATEAKTPAEAAAKSDVVLICVSDTAAVEAIVYGTAGILGAAHAGLIVVDCTTSEPSSTTRISADLAARGAAFVDAPVARSPRDAEQGRLNAMVGASDELFRDVLPILQAFCENVFHIGGSGAGHTMKLIYNFLTIGQVALFSEALVTAARAGLDLPTLRSVVEAGAANSGVFQMLVASTPAGPRTGFDFQLDLARKDASYYARLTEQLGLPGILGDTVHQSLVLASALGFGDRPVGTLVDALAMATGTTVPEFP